MTEIECETDTTCHCLASDLMALLGRKYVMDVVCILENHGRVRFGDVESHLPDASTSTLSARLDDLESADLVERRQYDEIPPRVEYELTESGRELGERLRPVVEWIADRERSECC
jgi:DNA-binding HxlR family transcriptional regulator